MALARRRLALLALTGFLLAGAWVASAPWRQAPLRDCLPDDGAAPGWIKDGEPQEFEGEELYTYIDGGAEIYQEYGFRRVVVQDYKNGSGKSVSLEAFEMEAPAAAFGMFTFKRSGSGKSVELGAGGELEAYYLNFWKGRILVTLTGFDESPGTIAGLEALAGIVESKLAGGGEVPQLVDALPVAGLLAGSVKYLRGPIGLSNVYFFGTARGLAFEEAVKGTYDSGATLMVLRYGSVEDRASAWLELGASLEASDRFQKQGPAPTGSRLYLDGKGRSVAIAESGPRLIVGIGPGAAAALEIVDRAR